MRCGGRVRGASLYYVGDNDALGRLEPLAVGRDLGEGAQGLHDGVAAGFDHLRAFEEELRDRADVEAALFKKAEGVGMAINGRVVLELEFVSDHFSIAPAEEFLLDQFAVGVVANGASAPVAAEVWSGLRSGMLLAGVQRKKLTLVGGDGGGG